LHEKIQVKENYMSQHDSTTIRKPRTDDRPLWDVLLAIEGYPAVLVAHELKLFTLLADKPLSLEEICAAKNLARRPAHALLAVATALGFLRFADGRYTLTPLAEDYLLEDSPTYFGGAFDGMLGIYSVYSPTSLKQAVLTDSPQGIFAGAEDPFKASAWQAEQARSFTRFMHGLSIAPALAWPDVLDLASHRVMLDVGGGSGAHCIGALRRWPQLRAIVLDNSAVCQVAQEFAVQYGLQERLSTTVGEFWIDPFPPADLHFYGMIFHDWPPEKCRFLARKSFDALEPGGRIIVHELLFNDDRTGPFAVAAQNVNMLLAMQGQQYSGQEISAMFTEAGFIDIEVKPTFGYWSIVSGRKS
jgi:ubiquinone/menaquinone biosynthesis C-methylase UbiE